MNAPRPARLTATCVMTLILAAAVVAGPAQAAIDTGAPPSTSAAGGTYTPDEGPCRPSYVSCTQ